MVRLRPGWLVALCAAMLVIASWLPWLTTSSNGGGRASAIGGVVGDIPLPRFGAGQLIVLLGAALIVAGAMAGRGLSERWASAAALALSLLLVGLTAWYYSVNVKASVIASYGLYVGGAFAICAVVCSVWALITASARR